VEVREACGGARGDKGWLMVAAHGDPWFTGEKERRRKQLELGACMVKDKEVQITSLCPPGWVKQREERRGGKRGLKLRRRRRGSRRRLGVAVAHAWQDSEEGKEIRGMERTTRGRWRSRRWMTAVCTAAAGGGAAPAAEQKK
jgi:hypothetical protein